MKISVIIPCYNCEKYVSSAIDSIVQQKIKPIEILLVYDHSKDNTLKILKEKEDQNKDLIKIIISKEKKGLSFARNLGISNALGDYLLFMDADDIAEPDLIVKYIDRLNDLNSASIGNRYMLCYSAYIQIDENDRIISDVCRGMQFKCGEALGYEFIRNYIMSPSGVLLNKEYFLRVGGFNEKLFFTEDWDLWLRLAPFIEFAYVDEPLVRLRRHTDNMSTKISTQLNAETNILGQYDIKYIKTAIFKRDLGVEQNIVDYVSLLFRLDYWEEGSMELENLLKKGYDYYNIYFYLGIYYLKNNYYKNALNYFKKTIEQKDNHGAALNNMGALLLLDGKREEARGYLEQAINLFPNYIDANDNYKLIDKEDVFFEGLKFTWRELREVLTSYSG